MGSAMHPSSQLRFTFYALRFIQSLLKILSYRIFDYWQDGLLCIKLAGYETICLVLSGCWPVNGGCRLQRPRR